jgi:hypothetical protein
MNSSQGGHIGAVHGVPTLTAREGRARAGSAPVGGEMAEPLDRGAMGGASSCVPVLASPASCGVLLPGAVDPVMCACVCVCVCMCVMCV